MPRYYFNFREGEELEADPEGQDLPNVEAAKNEARFYASELLRDAAVGGEASAQTVEVTDAKGELILRFRCSDVEVIEK
jgi:hypothetical protein